jgi:hypothetical protein
MKIKNHLTEILNSKSNEKWDDRYAELYNTIMNDMKLTYKQARNGKIIVRG